MTLFHPDGSLLTRRPAHGLLMMRRVRAHPGQHEEWVITCKCERELHILLRPSRMDCWRVGDNGPNTCRVMGQACWKSDRTRTGLVLTPRLVWRGHFATTDHWHADDPNRQGGS